jgi:hypothetical protein
MINHSLPAFSSISTRSIGAAVAHSYARFCRLPRVRKANGIEFCRVGRPEARPPLPFFTLPPRFGRESLCWDGQRDFFIFSPLALSH